MTSASTEALVIHAAHDLRLDTSPLPEPGPGEVRINMEWGGICGSDLHYFAHGGVGASVLHNPMILGHEVSGTVAVTGPDVTGFTKGDPVAIHPARPCGDCPECRRDRRNLCRNVRFLGSAAFDPHTDGGFRRAMTVDATQLRHLPPGLDTRRACLAEPLAVALHAISRAGEVRGRSALVQGAGPIGLLIVAGLVHAGAARIVATDLQNFPLERALLLGAQEGHNSSNGPLEDEFDIVFEATGAAAALPEAIARTRRGGILVQVGMFPPGNVSVPLAQIISRELDFRGTFRFDHEFDDALALLAEKPEIADTLVTREFPITRFQDAFALAPDRTRAAKVLLALSQ
ncbi:L-idonate 5-dehydrogenase [Acetobacter fallax]|uniref:Alcohol dehydrogenase catalytic domain-containing protein n=1 Tax=Acetobacter fallax TaxID=1737473 RepID=A0ABX0KA03_9PROT|nr:L-idonate 5-dehydrogenase [Acetobacter fallax]NHO31663.1 alcohol dehydrogenase catalytic domain-containing protein [Acetobacter fallax]NHO35222.1 alcohol dehydrogenase catalytic domain-containing protein [Acetobacter fallax]